MVYGELENNPVDYPSGGKERDERYNIIFRVYQLFL